MNKGGKNASALYLFATLFNKGIAFLTVPIFTRLLSTSDYGIVTTYNSWVEMLTVGLSLALYMAIRTAFVDFQHEKKSFLNTVITFTLCISVAAFLIVLLTGYYFTGTMSNILLFAVIQGTSAALLMDYQQYLMMDFKYVSRSLFMAVPNLMATLASILVIEYIKPEHLYLGRIIPTMCVYSAWGLIVLIDVYSSHRPQIKKEHLKYGLAISLPLVLHGIALTILSQSDRTMLTVLIGADQTGIYSLVYNFSMIATVLTTALDGVWLPWFMSKMKEAAYCDINERAKDYIDFITMAMFGLILIGPEILKVMADEKYWEGVSIIPPIVLANYFIFMYTFFVNVEHYHKKTVGITVNTVIAAGINIILNFLFIPRFGYVAAAYTTLASYLVSMILHSIVAHKMEKEILPNKQFLVPLLELTVSTVFYYIFMNLWLMRWIFAFGTVAVVAVIKRKKIFAYLRK